MAREVCSHPDQVWYPQRRVCYATAERLAAQRAYDDLHSEESGRVYHDGTFREWSPKRTPWTPYKYDDGVTIFVLPFDHNPDDNFLGAPKGSEAAEDGGASGVGAA